MDERKRSYDKVKKILIYMASFLIPIIVFMIIAAESKIYPFGEYNFLDDDSLYQYIPLLKGLKRKILSGEGFDYTWNLGLGTNYAPMYAYYLSSLLNWLFVFVPMKYITDIYTYIICFKIGLCGLSFAYYLVHKFKENSIFAICMSVCYALSSYVVWFCSEIMWLDCLILFPILIISIEKMFKEKKTTQYYIVLTLTIISNYYIAMIICMFLIIYFIVMVISEEVINEEYSIFKSYILRFKDFILYSLLAGATSAAVILPAILGLSATQSGDISFPQNIRLYSSFSEMAVRMLVCTSKYIRVNRPNLFCSVIILILVPIYLLDKSYNKRKKIGFIIITIVMMLSFEVNIFDYIWSGFHFTNGLFARNSFIYIFFVLSCSYEVLINIRNIKDKNFLFNSIGASIFILLLWKITVNEYREKIFILSLFFIIIYIGLMVAVRSLKKGSVIIKVIMLIIISYEMYMNAGEAIGSSISRTIIYEDEENTVNSLKIIEKDADELFVRVEKTGRIGYDDGEMQGYQSASMYSSTAYADMIDFYETVGMQMYINNYIYDGFTPIVNSLLGIDYFIDSSNSFGDNCIYNLEKVEMNNDKSRVYRNDLSLPVVFPINADIDKNVWIEEKNPFVNLNNIYINATSDTKAIYEELEELEKNENSSEYVKTFKVNKTGYVFFKSKMWPYNIEVKVLRNDNEIIVNNYHYSLSSYICYVGDLKEGDIVKVKTLDEDTKYKNNDIYIYTYNADKLYDFYKALYNDSFKISEVKSGYIKGKIETDKDTELFTSIPYDKGWTVYVDGKKVKVGKNFSALIKFEVCKGNHIVEMKYTSPGRISGMIITVVGVLGFILTIFIRKTKITT